MIPKILRKILSTSRPYGSTEDEDFVWWLQQYITNVLQQECVDLYSDDLTHLAFYVCIGDSKTMFSCHTDTATAYAGNQDITIRNGTIRLANPKYDMCLGADDGAGIYLMLEMIKSGVTGTYVFHRAEEVGCIGSMGIAQEHPDFLRRFDHAIAFDRQSTCSVITRQRFGRCCSDEFAIALSRRLSTTSYELYPDPTGYVTDTAYYINYIPECTNISVGYHYQHTSEEKLNLKFLGSLMKIAIHQKTWDDLPVKRIIKSS